MTESTRPSPVEPSRVPASLDEIPLTRPVEDSHDRRGMALRLLFMAVAGAVAFAFGNLVQLPDVPLCTMKNWTGYPCPGCGMTRSVVQLGGFDILSSLRFHPLGVLLGAGSLAVAVGAVIGLVRGRDPVWAVLRDRGHVIIMSFVAALLVIWVVRVFVVPEWSPDPIPG